MRVSELAKALGGEVFIPQARLGDKDPEVERVAPIETAAAGEVTFFTQAAYASFLSSTKASVLITSAKADQCAAVQIIHPEPHWAFAKTAQIFHQPQKHTPGISPHAYVDPSAQIGENVTIMPGVFIGEAAKIGPGSVLYPHVYVHGGVCIGADCILHPSVVLHARTRLGDRVVIFGGAVLGADGFGFIPGPDGLAKIPQTGGVRIDDDVEIGANSTVDCGAMADTVVGRGTKLDSHVHVAHNVQIGEHCMVCGMSAIAGSAKLKNRVIIGGHSCVNNHVEMGDGVILGGHSALVKDAVIPGPYIGFPAEPASEWRRLIVRQRKLDVFEKRLRSLEKLVSKS